MRSTLWLVSLAVVVALTTMPWSNYIGYCQGNRVTWVPFSDHELPEILLNVALFFPFGYFFPRALYGPSLKQHWGLSLITATMLSTGVNFFRSVLTQGFHLPLIYARIS